VEGTHIVWVERAAPSRDRTSPFIILLDAPQSSLPPGMMCVGDDMVVYRQRTFFSISLSFTKKHRFVLFLFAFHFQFLFFLFIYFFTLL
jgi:hypothetical protein